jgi:hypothetical protein
MSFGSPLRRLIHGVLGAALAALLGTAQGHALPLEQGPVVPAGSIRTLLPGARHAVELRVASERTLKAPPEKAARTRRPSTSSGSGVLPAPVLAGAVSAPVVFFIRSATAVVSLPGECGHCTRAPRPPPIS